MFCLSCYLLSFSLNVPPVVEKKNPSLSQAQSIKIAHKQYTPEIYLFNEQK